MARLTIQDLQARREAAQKERDLMQPLYDECYDYVIPYRRPAEGSRGGAVGDKRVNKIYDQTAVKAAMRFPGKLQQDLCPPEQNWFALEPGPIAKRTPASEELGKQLEGIAETAGSAFATGEWDTAFHEMGTDLLAGTGAMLMLEGDDQRWARFIAVSADELLLEPGPYNDITGRFWTRKWRNAAIMQEWPEGKYSDEFTKKAKEHPNEETIVHQDCVWDPKRKKWCLYVWLKGEEKSGFIHRAEFFTSPWLTPRYFKLPGETWGRGPGTLAMPTIKTLNTAVGLTLKAAAIALLGIYTYTPHSQFNPDNARIEPGQFWPVASNGGVLGEGIKKFEAPRIDLSQIVLNELRMGIEATMLDQSLPPDTSAVKSATEIVERVKRLAADFAGAFGRLVMEIVIPAVQRVIEIAHRKKLIPVRVPIDQLLVAVKVTSPVAQARRTAAVQQVIQFLAMAAEIAPNEVNIILDKVELLVELAVAFGVPKRFINSKENRDAVKERVKEIIAQAMAAAQAQEAQAAAPVETAPPAPAPA